MPDGNHRERKKGKPVYFAKIGKIDRCMQVWHELCASSEHEYDISHTIDDWSNPSWSAQMVECTFELNGQPMSMLKLKAMQLPAFSGLRNHVNQRRYACHEGVGPIPPGIYYILDRQAGGLLGPLRDFIQDRSDWFALYAADAKIDDETFCNKVKRGNFRLHPKGSAGISRGCITIQSATDFNRLKVHLRAGNPSAIPGSALTAYGRVKVT